MMTQKQFALALKKQRLQIRCAEQRRQLTDEAAVLMPLFTGAEYARSGWLWVRQHPEVVVGTVVVVVVVRPRATLRWARRGWLLWLTVRKWMKPRVEQRPFGNYLIEGISTLFSR